MKKPPSASGPFTGAGKWIMVIVTTVAAVLGLLANARYLGLTPWLALSGGSLADRSTHREHLLTVRDLILPSS